MYQCKRPPDKQAAGTPTDALPGQTIHPEKTPTRRCSQSECEGSTSAAPALRRLQRSSEPQAPNLLHGCAQGTIPDARPGTQHTGPAHVAARREMPAPTCDETPASRWPGSPDN